MKCHKCGSERNEKDDNFCRECSAKLKPTPQTERREKRVPTYKIVGIIAIWILWAISNAIIQKIEPHSKAWFVWFSFIAVAFTIFSLIGES